MIRRWSEFVHAVYVEDGLFGRRVDLVDTRENVALQAVRADQNAGSNKRRISGAPGGSVQPLRPPDDLNPDCDSEPSLDVTPAPRQTRVTNPTAGAK